MFEAFRKNFQNMQEGITSSLQRLSVTDHSSSSEASEHKVVYNTAESDLLKLYQSQWATLHHMADQNAKAAELVDKKIYEFKEECEGQNNKIVEIHSLLVHLPNIMSQLHSTLATIGSIRSLFEEVEGELLLLSDIDKELEVQEQILDLKLNASVHSQIRMHKFSQLKDELEKTHKAKLKQIEDQKEKQRQQKQKEYSQNFLQDVENYQKTGTVCPRANYEGNKEKALTLEDIDLSGDNSQLEEFLEVD